MRRKDVIHSPMHELEDLKEQIPEWVNYARQVVNRWESGKTLLESVLALGLKEAYEMGVAGMPPPDRLMLTSTLEDQLRQPARKVDTVRRRTRPARVEAPEPPAPKLRVSRRRQ